MRRLIYLCFAILIIALTGCRSQRAATSQQQGNVPAQVSEQEWTNVYMPVTVRLSKPMSISLSGRATMVRDSVVNVSMRVLGMEVGVVNVTADSVWVVDKIHKYYFAESTKKVFGRYDMNMTKLQRLILGADGKAGQTLTFAVPGSSNGAKVTFGQYVNTPAGPMAETVDIEGALARRELNATVQWQFDRATWNDPARKVNFSGIPGRGYKRIEAADIIEQLKQ